jgi:hypothetical protein
VINLQLGKRREILHQHGDCQKESPIISVYILHESMTTSEIFTGTTVPQHLFSQSKEAATPSMSVFVTAPL